MREQEPGAAGARIHDLDRLRPGGKVEVWHRGQLLGVGAVEEVALALGVVWIREDLDGYRRLIHTHDDMELRAPRHGHGG